MIGKIKVDVRIEALSLLCIVRFYVKAASGLSVSLPQSKGRNMTIANPPHVSDCVPDHVTKSASISPGRKIFLAACIILIGVIVAVVQLRDPSEFLEHGVFDSHLISAPLPFGAKLNERAATPDSILENDKKRTEINAKKSKNIENIPALAQTPRIDGGAEKYAQAYPQPVLIVDESVLDHSTEKTNEKSKTEIKTPKPFVSVNTEFKPIHQFEKLRPSQVGDIPKDISQPKGKTKGIEDDELLALFDFAENLGPIGGSKTNDDMPENPFGPASGEKVGITTVFDPDSTIILVPLEPLSPQKTNLEKTDGTVPLEPLSPLEPLRGEILNQRQHAVGVTVRLAIRR